jgi:PAS domain S-box-containing protein
MGEVAQTLMPHTRLFRDVFNASPIGISVQNLQRRLLFVNPSFCSFLGFNIKELRNKHVANFCPPEDAAKDWALFQQLRAGSIDHYQLEKRYFRRDGSLVWGRLSLSLLDGRPSPLVIAMVEDIGEKKKAEEKLANANERLRLAIESGLVGGWEWDIKGDKTYWFGKAHAQLGMTPDDSAGSREEFWERVHEDDRERLRRAMQLGRDAHEGFSEDFRVVWRDGTTHWLRSRGRYQYAANGEPERLLGISVNITESKQAEQGLREMNRALEEQSALLQSREELLRVFVKNVPAAVAMFDREMRYLEVNDRWCTTYSVDASQILGRSHYDAFPDLPEHYKEVHRRGLAGETIRSDEDRWDREGGTITWARWEVRPWKNAEGSLGGILIFAEDITRRKQMEEALSDMSRKLIESQEQERARIGRELHDDISQRLAMLAMEFDQLECNRSEDQSRVQRLREQTMEISSDVQALSHELHSSKLEYVGVAAGIKSWCKEFAARHRIEIHFKNEVTSVLPFEVGLCLFRVLQEALHNSVKHSGADRIDVRLAEQTNEVLLTISDFGAGFDIEAAKQNWGLGLTSMQERARLVNGTIEIQSKPMCGTTVRVRVPFKSEHTARSIAG